ncbi:MAG: DNA-directed RNA polymerase subunit omega [Lachnospiraceae bacterium]|nr:DNA-directed RNA polymerase subunit omega [Lachnospiraceae bacterium]
MIHPSYVDLMQVVNSNVEEGEEPVISSRYSIVMATARRARQLIAGDEALVRTRRNEKALSIAVDELNEGEVYILTEEQKAEMEERRRLEIAGIGDAVEEAVDAKPEAEEDEEEDEE